jgi:DNA-binding CsgD family transcriptional regulator
LNQRDNPAPIDPAVLARDESAFVAVGELIGRIYECAIDPGQWDDTLAAIIAQLSPPEWDVAMLVWERLDPPGCRYVGTSNLIPMAREIYRAMFAGRTPWTRRLWTLPAGRVVDTDEIMPRSEILESDFYRKFLHTWNIELAIGVVVDRLRAEKLALIMPGPPGPPLDGLKRGLRLLVPHIQRAVRISRALGEANLRATAAQSALDMSPEAVVALTADLKVMNANAKAQDLIEAGWARIACDRFAFAEGKAQRHLAALAAAAPPTCDAFHATGADGSTLAVLATRLTAQTADTLGGRIEGAAILVTIGLGARAPLIAIDRLGAWYGLTPAEARLAAGMAAGTTLQDYANRRAVSMNAIRFLLKGIYRKVGVETQGQLVARLRSLPAG